MEPRGSAQKSPIVTCGARGWGVALLYTVIAPRIAKDFSGYALFSTRQRDPRFDLIPTNQKVGAGVKSVLAT